jgi:anti-anti-sigma factor
VKEGEIEIITVNGQLDADTAPVADKIVKKILEGDCLRMLFDFSALGYLGSGGLRVILGAIKELYDHLKISAGARFHEHS